MKTYTTAEASADRLKTKQMAVTSSVDDVQGASVDSFQHTKFIERSHKRGSANFVPKRTRYVDSNVTNDITHWSNEKLPTFHTLAQLEVFRNTPNKHLHHSRIDVIITSQARWQTRSTRPTHLMCKQALAKLRLIHIAAKAQQHVPVLRPHDANKVYCTTCATCAPNDIIICCPGTNEVNVLSWTENVCKRDDLPNSSVIFSNFSAHGQICSSYFTKTHCDVRLWTTQKL